MSAEAKHVAIRWRRMLFGFHALIWLITRLAVGSLGEMPPAAIYNGLSLWGFVVFGHGLLLAIFDGYDQAELPFAWMRRLVNSRERRLSLLTIDAAAWVMATTAIAIRIIPYHIIERYAAPLSLAWLVLTAFGIFHILLVIYGEVREITHRKRKNIGLAVEGDRLALADDGELIDFKDELRKHTDRD